MAIGAGVCMALALPGPGLFPLVLAVPGLLRRSLKGRRGWAAARTGFVAGFTQWAIAVPWVVIVLHRYGHAPLPVAVAGWLAMAAILATTWALAAWATCLCRREWATWLLPLALAACEVLQGYPPWHFPWNPVSATATAWWPLLLPLPVVGSAGLSLLVLAVGGALDALWAPGLRRRGAFQLSVALAAFAAASAAAPTFRGSGREVRVAALQPDVPLEVRWDAASRDAIEGTVWGLSRQAVGDGAEWIVWPESAVPRVFEQDGAYRVQVEEFVRSNGVWLLLGSIGLAGGGEGEYFNSVYPVAPAGRLPWRYDKIHLVPFGEYVPIVGRISLLRPLVREVGGFTPGMSALPVPGPVGPVGVEVCYEVAFPSLAAEQVQLGAGILATITNDGWYGDSAAPRQHLALARLRAAESRRFLVRAANTGISAIIDPYGRNVATLGMGQRGIVAARVQGGEGATLASVHGTRMRLMIVTAVLSAILLDAWIRGATRRDRGRTGKPGRS